MDFRYLGNSGLKISEIIYGNWLTHGSQVENDTATASVHAALDADRHLQSVRKRGSFCIHPKIKTLMRMAWPFLRSSLPLPCRAPLLKPLVPFPPLPHLPNAKS